MLHIVQTGAGRGGREVLVEAYDVVEASMNAAIPKQKKPASVFGERLAALRKIAGNSQREFAEEIGISHRMVAYYEAQTEHPPAHLLPTIAKALHLSTDQVLGLEEIQKRQRPINQRLLRKMKVIEALPARDQRPLLRTINAYLKGAERK